MRITLGLVARRRGNGKIITFTRDWTCRARHARVSHVHVSSFPFARSIGIAYTRLLSQVELVQVYRAHTRQAREIKLESSVLGVFCSRRKIPRAESRTTQRILQGHRPRNQSCGEKPGCSSSTSPCVRVEIHERDRERERENVCVRRGERKERERERILSRNERHDRKKSP